MGKLQVNSLWQLDQKHRLLKAWTLRRGDFGSAGKNAPCLMLGFSTLVQTPTDMHLSQRSTAVRNSWKGMPTKSVFGKLKEHPLFRWSSLRLEAQAPLQPSFSKGWQLDWLKLETWATPRSWAGYVVGWASVFFGVQWCVFAALDPDAPRPLTMYQTLLALQQGLILPPEFIRFVCFTVLFLSKFCQVHFQFCLSPQYPPIFPNCSSVLFCGLLYLAIAYCLSLYLFAIVWCMSLLYFMCCGLLHILFVKLCVSLSFFFCLMRFSSVFIFSFGIFVIFVHC